MVILESAYLALSQLQEQSSFDDGDRNDLGDCVEVVLKVKTKIRGGGLIEGESLYLVLPVL